MIRSGPRPSDVPSVVVEDLVIRYGDLTAVDRVSLRALAGQVTVLLGPNGAGKTSIVEHLEGYRRAAAGRSRVLDLDPVADHAALTRRVGVMLQQGGIPTGIRPLEVLRQYAGFFDDPRDPEELLRTVGLSARRSSTYRRLSGGEQQRLSLALALVGRPWVVFLDEPTAGVDLEGRDLIRAVIDGLREEGVCVVLTTHDLDEAQRIADHVVIIDRGTVVAAGSTEELVQGGEGDHLLFGAPPGLDVAELSTALGATVEEVTRGEYRVDAAPEPVLVATLTSWLAERELQLADLRAQRQRLDDVFRRLTTPAGDQGSPAPDGHEPVPDEPDAEPVVRRRRRRRGG
jgi:ABC-2 type transport system ATP-binding protein